MGCGHSKTAASGFNNGSFLETALELAPGPSRLRELSSKLVLETHTVPEAGHSRTLTGRPPCPRSTPVRCKPASRIHDIAGTLRLVISSLQSLES